MPDTIAPPQYEPQTPVKKINTSGQFTFKGRTLRTSKAFAGKQMALRATHQDGLFDLCYRRHVVAQVDLRNDKTVHLVPEKPSTLSPV